MNLGPIKNSRVYKFLDSNRYWDREALSSIFGDILAQRIFAIPMNISGGNNTPKPLQYPSSMTIMAMAYK